MKFFLSALIGVTFLGVACHKVSSEKQQQDAVGQDEHPGTSAQANASANDDVTSKGYELKFKGEKSCGGKPSGSGGATPGNSLALAGQTTQDYINQCNQMGVSIPGTFAVLFKKVGVINSSQLLIGPGNNGVNLTPPKGGAEIWVWTSVDGLTECIAYPRYENGVSVAIGMICYNKSKNLSCFFDYRKDAAPGTPIKISDFDTPNSGIGTVFQDCASCHTGGNPYIITPPINNELFGTPYAKGSETAYTPIGFPPGSNPVDTSGITCAEGCHVIPALQKSNCLLYLDAIAGNPPYMPPAKYQPADPADLGKIQSQCCGFFPQHPVCKGVTPPPAPGPSPSASQSPGPSPTP